MVENDGYYCRCLGRRERNCTKESSFTLASFARCCNAELCPCSPPSRSHTHTSTHTHSRKTKRRHAVSQSQSVGERNLRDGCPLAGRWALGTHASLPHTFKVACLRSDSFLHPSIPSIPSQHHRSQGVSQSTRNFWRYLATTDRFVLGLAHLLPLARAADSNFSTAAYLHISTLGRPTEKREPSPLPPALGSTCASTSYLRDRDWNSAVLPPLALLCCGRVSSGSTVVKQGGKMGKRSRVT